MSAAAVLGIVLMISFVGVALVAFITWRKRMQETMPYGEWRQAVNVKEVCS